MPTRSPPLKSARSATLSSTKSTADRCTATPRSSTIPSTGPSGKNIRSERKNIPSLDAAFSAVWLKETPTATFHIGPVPTKAPMGTKRNFEGSLTLEYPLFTGFAVTAAIDKAAWRSKEASLKVLDLKRNLYMKATHLAALIKAATEKMKAMKKAKPDRTVIY